MGDLLLPAIDADSAPFWAGTLAGELRVQTCAACGRRRFPPRPMCPWCRSVDSLWPAVSGRGRIWSWVIAHPPLLEPYASAAPYPVAVVALEDDPAIRLVGDLVAGPDGSVGEIAIDAPVTVTFDRVSDDVALPRWILARW
jgi:uncharacterized OB-fold protein